jgi:hypothetical protein
VSTGRRDPPERVARNSRELLAPDGDRNRVPLRLLPVVVGRRETSAGPVRLGVLVPRNVPRFGVGAEGRDTVRGEDVELRGREVVRGEAGADGREIVLGEVERAGADERLLVRDSKRCGTDRLGAGRDARLGVLRLGAGREARFEELRLGAGREARLEESRLGALRRGELRALREELEARSDERDLPPPFPRFLPAMPIEGTRRRARRTVKTDSGRMATSEAAHTPSPSTV